MNLDRRPQPTRLAGLQMPAVGTNHEGTGTMRAQAQAVGTHQKEICGYYMWLLSVTSSFVCRQLFSPIPGLGIHKYLNSIDKIKHSDIVFFICFHLLQKYVTLGKQYTNCNFF